MSRALQQTRMRERFTQWNDWEIHCLLVLIAITGTDYSRGLPLVGPKKVWRLLPTLLPLLTSECFARVDGTPVLSPDIVVQQIYSAIYAGVFHAHCKTSGPHFDRIIDALHGSKLSTKSKQALPSYQRAACTVRNANFILAYWTGAQPDSMDPQYGFRERGGVVVWDD